MNDVVIVCRTILVWFDDKGHDSAFAFRGIFADLLQLRRRDGL
jgi:hypothetical protein